MADFYCDISAVGNEYQAYADTPATWGVPQDGNGKAGPGHSAAVAIATIDCTSAVGDGAQTLSILGVSVSNASAGSGATLAASLVTSINGTTTATTTTYCQALLPLNKLIFARQNPGAMAEVQVMLRIAGADWNGMAPTHAGFTTGPTITAFTGGADGPFAYYINASSVFGKAANSYGIRVAKSPSPVEPSEADARIVVRCYRTSSLTLSLTIGANTSFLTPAFRSFLYDSDGGYWGTAGQFTLSVTASSSYTTLFSTITSGTNYVSDVAATKDGFRVLYSTSGSGVLTWTGQSASGTYTSHASVSRVLFEEANSSSVFSFGVTGNGAVSVSLTDCRYIFKSPHSFVLTNYYYIFMRVIGGSIEYSGVTQDVPYLVATGNYVSSADVEFVDVIAVTGGPAYKVVSGIQALSGGNIPSVSVSFRFINCSGIRATSFSFPAAIQAAGPKIGLWSSSDTNREFRYEYQTHTGVTYVADWIADGSYPGLRTQLVSGIYQTIRCAWLLSASAFKPVLPLVISAFNQTSAGIKTITLEFLATTDDATVSDVGMVVSYTGADGSMYNESTIVPGSSNKLSTSSVTGWMNSPGGSLQKLLTLTTDHSVASGSTISCQIVFSGTPTTNTSFYFDPTPEIA